MFDVKNAHTRHGISIAFASINYNWRISENICIMRDDPLKNLSVVQAVRDIPQLYQRESGIPKKELEKLWNRVGNRVDLPGASVLFTFSNIRC